MEEIYCTYAYLREDRTPYYIGKGCKNRSTKKSGRVFLPPTDSSRILILKKNLTEEEAFKHEIYMIDVFGRKDLGTGILRNLTNGGEGVSGYRHTEEDKKRMSKSHENPSEEVRKKLSKAQSGEKNHQYGVPRTEETKKKLSEANSGEKHPQFGIPHTDEWKKAQSERMSGERNPRFGVPVTKEIRQKISEANSGEKHYNYGKKWWTDGVTEQVCRECPGEGWINKRLKRQK